MPNVFWHSAGKQWASKIGYWLLPCTGQTSAPGKRVRAYQYLGKNQSPLGRHEADSKALQFKALWDKLASDWPAVHRPFLEKYLPDFDWSKPVWSDHKFILSLIKKIVEQGHEEKKVIEEITVKMAKWDQEDVQKIASRNPDLLKKAVDPLGRVVDASQTLTINQAKTLFLAAVKSRTEMKRGRNIKNNSYNNTETQLNISLRPVPKEKIVARNPHKSAQEIESLAAMKPIDTGKKLGELTKKDIEGLVDYWWSNWNGLRPRTAKNYCIQFLDFLRWCADQEEAGFAGFNLPKGIDKLFKFGAVNPVNIAKYDPMQLKSIADNLPTKGYLYMLLGLAGMYQIDISHVRFEEIVKLVKGEPIALAYEELTAYDGSYDIYVYRLRDRTEHKIDQRAKSLIWLFSETGKLLAKFAAKKDNHFGYVLLNRDGQPLLQSEADECRSDAISNIWFRATGSKGANTDLSFKQLRKIGSTAVASLSPGDTDTVIRLYRSQPPVGDAKFYVIDDFQKKLTPVLKQWAEKLRLDKVLVDTHQPPRRRGKNKKTSAKEPTATVADDHEEILPAT